MESLAALERRFRAGDTTARDELIVASIPIVTRITNKIVQEHGGDFDDYFQEAMIVAINVVDRCPSNNVAFTTSLNALVRHHLNKIVADRCKEEMWIDREISIVNVRDNRMEISLTISQRDYYIADVLSTLRPREEKVIRCRFGLDDGESKSLETVGRKMNRSSNRVRQIEARALRKLRHPSCTKKIRDYIYIEE